MMRATTEQKLRRWAEQRWILDAVISTVGMEWDQPRLGYTMYPCGPDAVGDFRTVGTRVRKFADMHREFAAAARRREAKAKAFEDQGRFVSARESWFIASLLYSAARWPIFENSKLHIDYNLRMIDCYKGYIRHAPRPVTRVEIPFAGKFLPGYLTLPREPKTGEKFPCVIGIDGMDGSKEIMCSMYGDKFLERGMASFVYDGPGQGECPVNGLWVTADNHMPAAQAVHDWLVQQPHIDASRLVIAGISFGSYFGLQAAAQLGTRVKGAGVAFVCHEPGCYSIFNMAAPSFKLRFMYMSNYDDEDAFDDFIAGFSLHPVVQKVACPVLIQAGEDEELSPLEFTDELVAKMTVPRRFVVWQGDRHAIGSSQAAYMGENWFTMLADWCLDRAAGRPAPSEHV
ncbi:MAG: alpha/beta hydrolase, partial [Betaproteobacteria bacterium]|nr:alpha/beta hydrolase [Betaproteobacteria bacterium]